MRKSFLAQGFGIALLSLCAGSLVGCSSGEPVQTEADKQAQLEQQKAEIAANSAAAKAATQTTRRRRR